MVLLVVADVVLFSQVTHEGLAARDTTCHPPLRGLVSPQNVELPACTKGYIQREWCKMHLVLCTRVSTRHVPQPPTKCLLWPLGIQEVTANIGL